jgi:hypothetical protein
MYGIQKAFWKEVSRRIMQIIEKKPVQVIPIFTQSGGVNNVSRRSS